MWSRLATKATAVALLATALAGCSDIYFDRRDSVSLAAGEAQAADRVTQTIDPWSRASANRHIAYSGERMQAAAERYRTHRIIRPISPMTSTTEQQQPPPALTTEEVPSSGPNANAAPAAPGSSAVK